ncbi:MAG: methyltransferase [Bacteroidota bacterium]
MQSNATRDKSKTFRFKQFTIAHDRCAMKVGTDGVLLGAWASVGKARRILDIGTGSGVIAIMLAQRQQGADVIGVEIDEQACEQAAANMAASPFADHLQAVLSPIQAYASQESTSFDLIVSNPPFFSGGVLSIDQDRSSVRHTVKLPHGDLLRSVRGLLAQDGRFCVILPYLEGLRFVEMAHHYNIHCSRQTEVIPIEGKTANRLLLEFVKEPVESSQESLCIRNNPEQFTEAYRSLTADFYLHF